MANRFFNQFGKTLEKEVVTLFMKATIGSSGAITLDAVNSKGIAAVSKIGTGAYRITFGTSLSSLDVYYKFFSALPVFKTAGGSPPLAPVFFLADLQHNDVSKCYIDVQFVNSSGVSTNPASGDVLFMEIKLGNSSAQ
jgi:hypothetical protein